MTQDEKQVLFQMFRLILRGHILQLAMNFGTNEFTKKYLDDCNAFKEEHQEAWTGKPFTALGDWKNYEYTDEKWDSHETPRNLKIGTWVVERNCTDCPAYEWKGENVSTGDKGFWCVFGAFERVHNYEEPHPIPDNCPLRCFAYFEDEETHDETRD